MALSRNGEIFYKEIFPKLVYDKELGKYKLNLTAYIPSSLNKRQTGVLERICIKNDIIMEKLQEKITISETEELFKKMKSLKEEIEISKDLEVKKQKEKEYYAIRTKIFETHQYLVYKLIMDTYPEIESSPYKEDIIQSCYEYLLHAIDNYDSNKSNQNFRWYLHMYVSKNIMRTITYIKNNGLNQDLINIMNIRENENDKGNNPDNQTLSILSGLSETRVEELLTLEQMLNAESIENLQAFEYQESDFDLEEIVNRKILREKLVKILETLSNEKQIEVMKLYCGLDKLDSYRMIEISKMLDIFRQRADQHRDDAIKLLSNSERLKYIKELYEGYSEIDLPENEEYLINETSLVYEKLERFLFETLYTKEELTNMIKVLDKKYQDVLSIHFELTDDQFNNFQDKIKKLNISSATYSSRKREGLSKLRKIFQEQYVNNNPNEDINTTLDYLMYNYLNKPKTKTRKKDGAN